MTQPLFHILSKEDADAAKLKGTYLPENYLTEGFIHCSYASQVCKVALNFYKAQKDLVLLEIDKSVLNCEVIDEDLYNTGEDFPHIYGELPWQAVVQIHEFPCKADGSFDLPKTINVSKVLLTATTQNDAEALVEIRIAAMQESLEKVGRFDPERARDRFLSSFQPTHTRFIEWDKIKVGFVVTKAHEAGLLLDHLYIHPDYQGNGIGGLVLEKIFAEADALKLAIRVGALRESDSNRFYLRHGFEFVEQGEFDNYYLRPAREV